MTYLKPLLMSLVLIFLYCYVYCNAQEPVEPTKVDTVVSVADIDLLLADYEKQRIQLTGEIKQLQTVLEQKRRNLIAVHGGILSAREIRAKALKKKDAE